MKVVVETHGGPLGNIPGRRLSIDSKGLPDAAAADLARLAEAAEAVAPTCFTPPQDASPSAPGAMTYRITIDHGDRSVIIRTSDIEAVPEIAAFRDWVTENPGSDD